MRFDELLRNDDLLDGLWDMHFDECTPIQEQAIPAVLEGNDLLACAQTGTGKTAAYLLPIIDLLADGGFPEDSVNCVIMAPTRELAQQIDRQLQGFSYFMPVSSMAIYGGTDGHTYEQQRKSLKLGADIVIATPGRLISHLSMGYVDLSKVSFFILDEADRMLDMGFFDDIMQIAGHMPKERQTLLFSATMPAKIQQLAKQILNNPVEVKLAVNRPADKIRQSAFICYEPQKLPLLQDFFVKNPPSRVIVFSSSKQKVKILNQALRKMKIQSAEMHSDLDQNKREDVILDFKAGKIKVLVATDILSRGIDIDDIECVINFDVPREAEDYVHRVGRTARADNDGRAVTFVNVDDFQKFAKIERLLGREIERLDIDKSFGSTPEYRVSNVKKVRNKRGGAGNKGKKESGKSDTQSASSDKKYKGRHRGRSGRRNNNKINNPQSRSGEQNPKPLPHGQHSGKKDL